MDERALEVWEAHVEGDTGKARSLLERYRAALDAHDVADLEAMLDGTGEEVALEALEASLDLTHPAPRAEPRSRPARFRSLAWSAVGPSTGDSGTCSTRGRSRCSDWTSWTAAPPACGARPAGTSIGFLAGSPGALQVGAPPPQLEADPAFLCRSCGWARREGRKVLLNKRLLTLLGLEFLGPQAHADVCHRCGLVHWSLTREGATPWAPVALPLRRQAGAGSLRCLGCAGERFAARKALLNTRLVTRIGLDWAEEGAVVMGCSDCGALSWFLPGSRFLS